ncbi:MAG: polyprenyl synthetase family protein [Nitrospirae bacterium]|nr:polyprenyl synthetase family protein [Nitrospirota bacterium]
MITEKVKDNSALRRYLEEKRAVVDRHLIRLLGAQERYPRTLYQAMHYSLSAGGKRIRPILSIASSEAIGGTLEDVIPAAVAIEMIHTYSLIHDDLPAMDNDDIRRGKPTNHKVFGEATAILAGDALLTLAFSILSDNTVWKGFSGEKIGSANILRVIHEIALSAGPEGMVGGQQLDIESEGKCIDIDAVEKIHGRKTGALILAAVRAGGIAGGATETQLTALTDYGKKIGLAFQIADDVLDVDGSIEEIGKSPGKDVKQHKNTYPAIIGSSESRVIAQELVNEAIEALDGFDEDADPLRMIAKYVVQRKS